MNQKPSPWGWFLIAALLSIVFIAGGYWYDQHQIKIVKKIRFNKLMAVGKLKSKQIADWRNEYLATVVTYAQNPLFIDAIPQFLRHPDNVNLKTKVRKEWELLPLPDDCANIILASPDGKVQLSLKFGKTSLTAYEKETVRTIMVTGQALFSKFFQLPYSKKPLVDAIAPMMDMKDRPLAALILQIDPRKELYPLLQFWPTASESSESYIFRREDKHFTLLSPHRNETPQNLLKIISLSQPTINKIGQVLKGQESIFEGKDSRGVKVIAHITAIKDTPWILVTKVNRNEILADARYYNYYIAIFVALLILITVVGGGLIFRHRRARWYKELHKVEKERNDLLEEFRITLYSIGDGVISMDESGRIRHMNPVAEELTGWKEAEARGRPVHEIFHIIHEETGEKVDLPIKRILQEGGVVRLSADTVLVSREDAKYSIADSAAPINGHRGKLKGFVLVFSNVTKEREAQRALKISEERYRKLFMEDLTGDFVSAPDGTFLDCNPAFAKILGFEFVEELKRHKATEFYPSAHIREKFLNVLMKEKKVTNYELEMKRIDGSTINVLENVTGKFDNRGNLVEIRGYLFDITEHKKLEKQFLQAQKMEAIGRLAGGVAHDFNNMLAVIIGYSEILLSRQTEEGTNLHNGLMQIKKAADRSADLTHQLLAFARKQVISPKIIDLNETVGNMIKMLRRLVGENIDLIWKPGTLHGNIKIDPAQMDQILANIVINARDAIDRAGKIVIETNHAVFDEAYCIAHPWARTGEYSVLSLSDNGCGMDESTVANIFEPFFTTKEKGKGTGLGLSTVYGIVKQNEGYIYVYSEPEHGTTFRIYFPMVTHDPSEKKAETSKNEDSLPKGTETILLVEDEPQILNMADQILESLGYTLFKTTSPEEALQIAKTHADKLDAVITDVILPGMNGKALLERLYSITPNIKCLYISGYTANAILHQGILDEGINFLQKPFSLNDLAIKIREVLDS